MNKLNLNTIYDWPIITRVLLIGLICSIVFYFGHKIDIMSLQKTLSTSQQDEKNLKQQIEGIISQQQTISSEIALFPIYNTKLKEWKSKFVSYPDLPELLNQILRLGADNELHFTLFSPGSPVSETSYLKVPIKVQALGNYHQIAAFLSQIANMQWIVTIRDFSISSEKMNTAELKTEANTSSNSLLLDLLLDVYYLAETKK